MVQAERERLAQYMAEQEVIFEELPTLTVGQMQLLRRSLNAQHLAAAQRFGIPSIPRREQVADRVEEANMVRISETSHYWVSRLTHSFPYVTPAGAAALDSIGVRFSERLSNRGLPPFRFSVTSVLRTAEDQARLRGVNVNAAQGPSSHQFGTTFDLHYQRFRFGGNARAEVEQALGPLPFSFLYDEFETELDSFYQTMATRYASRIGAELGRVLIALENEGVALSLRERLQPVYHVTVATRLGD